MYSTTDIACLVYCCISLLYLSIAIDQLVTVIQVSIGRYVRTYIVSQQHQNIPFSLHSVLSSSIKV